LEKALALSGGLELDEDTGADLALGVFSLRVCASRTPPVNSFMRKFVPTKEPNCG
jgi:hypothetical protein